jgi:antitoxin Phd
MYIDTNKMISITDANRNFSNLTKMVDREKQIVIMKNNKPKYAMMVYDESDTVQKETMLINDEKSDYGSIVISDRVENVSDNGTVRLPDSIIRKLNIDKTGTVTFIEEKNRVRVENTSKYALKELA